MVGRGSVDGPLEPFREGIRVELGRLGYSTERAGQLLLLVRHVDRWMVENGVSCGDLTDGVVSSFFVGGGRSWCRSPRSMRPVLDYLRGLGVVPGPQAACGVGRTAVEIELWDSFQAWGVGQRGLLALTAEGYARRAEACLRCGRPDGELVVADLDAGGVLAAVRAAAEVMPGPSLRCTVTALRSFLRFAYVTGRVPVPLAGAVPALKGRLGMVPPAPLSEHVADRLVASCDTATATGRRDAAILVVLGRLGLRAGEVAALGVDDIDWRQGEMTVAGKGGRVEVLPVPVDVGEAVVDYLSAGRAVTTCRALFLKAVAPFGPMSADGINGVVRLACDRAGVPRIGPHRLRHLVATATLAAGAPLSEIAQLLRHQQVATTAIYAAADPASIAALARSWPEATR
ncbi:MAG TPA: tyrosine-type recombinase/integrase [Acidimicrobiales bacterium]|nr:tyrosine-type recombinase/integrase [Acidimicrobiales bacterium]